MANQISKVSRWSMLLGNLFEHYDTALFSLLSPFIAPLFFPGKDPITALILTYCIIPIGMIARPIGSLFFGYIGDHHGREKALFLALMGMAFITVCMGLMPTYQHVGFFAPILLSFGRVLQNFCAAGESIGGAIYLIENSEESKKDLASSLFGASSVGGILLASFGVSVFCALDIIQNYWRVLYFLGCSTALFAIALRVRMTRNKEFSHSTFSRSSLKSVFKTCWNRKEAILTIATASGFTYATYMLALVLMNGLIPLVTSIPAGDVMHLNTILLILDFILLPFFGFLTKYFSRNNMMIIAGILSILSGLPLLWFLQGASLVAVIFIRVFLVIIGVWFCAPFYSWAQQLVPASERYTIVSFSYAIGSQLLGGPTAALSLWLFQQTGWIVSVGWYWMFLGFLSSYMIFRYQTVQKEDSVSVPIPQLG